MDSFVVVVPHNGHIELETEQSLHALEKSGITVQRFGGISAIDFGRSTIATNLLSKGVKEILWIDSDIIFHPQDVIKIRSRNVPLVGALYPKKCLGASLTLESLTDMKIVMGQGGSGLVQVKYLPGGFLYTKAEVYEAIREKMNLPICNESATPVVPYFAPAVFEENGRSFYLTEDFSFCRYARLSGYEVLLDTEPRLFHKGSYAYSWEETGMQPIPRPAKVNMNIRKPA